MDIDGLLDTLISGGRRTRPEALNLMKQYLEIERTLPIDDPPIRRLCEVMTANGCVTMESCEGHARDLPIVFFGAEDLEKVADLAYVLRKASAAKNYIWKVTVDPKLDSSPGAFPIRFTLQPIARQHERIDPVTDRAKLLFDLHYLGIAILSFNASEE
jgi:hypothetical protein